MNKLFQFLLKLLGRIRSNLGSKELSENMPRPQKLYKQRITLDQFDSSVPTPAYEIKRVGKKIYIVDATSSNYVTQSSIDDLSYQIKQSTKPMKIVTTGLSKAQVGRIVSNIKAATTKGIYIKKVAPSASNRTLTYEILATGEPK